MKSKQYSTKFESFRSNFILTGHFSGQILNVILGSVKYPWVSYEDALQSTGLQRLSHRRDGLSDKLFEEIVTDDRHKLYNLLPPRNETVNMTLRSSHRFNVAFQTNRFKNSFIIHNALNYSS
jgi:hypothetical protein